MDVIAKWQIHEVDALAFPQQKRFPLEPIYCYLGQEFVYLVLDQDSCQSLCTVLAAEQFDLIAWKHISVMLHEVPQLF